MSSIVDFSALTLNTEEARTSAEMVFEKAYKNPLLEQSHAVQEGVEMDKFIPVLGRYPEMGKIDPGGCDVNSVTSQIPVSQLKWEPKLVSGRLTHCQSDVPSLLKAWKKSRIAAGTWEEVDNEMMAFIEDRLSDALYRSILRISSFGDTDASPVGDTTGNEELTAGTDKDLFSMLDGLWKQIFTDQASGTPKATRVTISENSEATKSAQLSLADDAAMDAMEEMYNNIAPEAMDGSIVFQMTRSMYNNYLASLKKTSANFTLERIENGHSNVAFYGIPIVVRYDWDRNIKQFQDLGTTYHLPHRIILADINTIPLGTSDEGSLTNLDSFYDKTNKKHYIDFAYKIDVKALLLNEMAVAY
ncbi:MAG: hypothetical protein R6U85_08480 [Salinivirgaceae bacterium]